MRANAFRSLWLLAAVVAAPTFACEPLGYGKKDLLDPVTAKFRLPEWVDIDAMVLALADCLGDPDPEWRDAVGYTGIMTLLRNGNVETATIVELRDELLTDLEAPDTTGAGFIQPFAVLALAEVARVDRVSPFMSDDERSTLVDAGTRYLSGVRDYRGFVPGEGWRHGVAHGADLLMQLVLNAELDEAHIRPIVEAALSQANADGEHSYVFGESARLTRPVLFAARRGTISGEEWQSSLMALTSPPNESWATSFGTMAGQSQVHNVRAFLLNVYASVAESDNEVYAGIRDAARDALQALP